MNNPIAFLIQQMLSNNPNLRNNPNAQNWMNVIQNGDAKTGEEIAKNIAASYGLTPEQAAEMANKGLMGMFGHRP